MDRKNVESGNEREFHARAVENELLLPAKHFQTLLLAIGKENHRHGKLVIDVLK
ncbi:hypothetical protein [Neobacillus sp. DY30]|uniref:hypothetical protein n=1 Tax=Neobacillus sp. DY30 TaxID=3047871 RepID=UPI0024C015E5|nr:hypothetical protein [Neobacillus sp. DY30]WHY02622.1 hypothetical protein QNH29_10530 [Neobacillus sp. DY30]